LKPKKGNTKGGAGGFIENLPGLTSSGFKVKTDEARYDELGTVNFYGYVSKRRAELNAFHERWMVLRGFELYWYRHVGDAEQKGSC